MFNRTKSAVKKSLANNFDYMKKIVGTNEIADNAKWMAQMWQSLKPKSDRFETFEEAKARLHETEDDYAKARRNYIACFYIVLTGFLFCFGCLLANIVNKNYGGILSSIGIGLVLFASAFKFSFRAYQIKVRQLCSVRDYLNNKKEWFSH